MAFTQEQLSSVKGTNAPAPSFDPNGFTMQTLGNNQSSQPAQTNQPIGADNPSAFVNDLKTNLTQEGKDMGSDISKGSSDIASGTQQGGFGGLGTALKGLFEAGPETAWDAAKAGFEPITEATKAVSDQLSGISAAKAIASNPDVGSVLDTISSKESDLNAWSQQHPDAAKALGTVLGLGSIAVGESGPVQDATESLASKASDLVNQGTDKLSDIASSVKDKISSDTPAKEISPEQRTQEVTSAVSPNETGKNLVKAYKNVVKGTRTGGETGILKTQGLDPGNDAISLGQRLSDVPDLGVKGNTHLDNLNVLNKALNDTEGKIGEVTANDTTTGTKEELQSKFDDIKANKPSEFQIKGPNTKIYDKVVDFAKKVVGSNDETTEGFRDGRTAFDAQAKTEFPSAFKDNGSINTQTPAGSAIKNIRDTWNKYTYESSSRGPELQNHIQREADIFRATNNIAPRAAAQDGETLIDRFMDSHPGLKMGANMVERIGLRTAAGIAARGIIGAVRGALSK